MSAAESVFAAIRKHREQYGHWIGQCGGVHGFNYSPPGHYLFHGDKMLITLCVRINIYCASNPSIEAVSTRYGDARDDADSRDTQ